MDSTHGGSASSTDNSTEGFVGGLRKGLVGGFFFDGLRKGFETVRKGFETVRREVNEARERRGKDTTPPLVELPDDLVMVLILLGGATADSPHGKSQLARIEKNMGPLFVLAISEENPLASAAAAVRAFEGKFATTAETVAADAAAGKVGAEGVGGENAPKGVNYDPNLVPGPNPNGLRAYPVDTPSDGVGVYLKPHDGKTKVGSTGRGDSTFANRYSPNNPEGGGPIQVEIPQTRNGPPAGVDDSEYKWTPSRQRRFDEEYVDRTIPPESRYRAPTKPQSPVQQSLWDRFRHIFGYGDVQSDFGS
jgi:hypothetical protein